MKKDINTDYKYIIFPLPLLQEIFENSDTAYSTIFDIGIYLSAMTQNVSEYSAIKQAMYCYYRGGLTRNLQEKFDNLVNSNILPVELEYCGFDSYEFNPEDEINAITDYIKTDPKLANDIIIFHQLRQIKDVINVAFNIESIINTYNSFYLKYQGFEHSPLVMIKIDTIFEYYHKKKSEFENILFAVYAAIRSLKGKGRDVVMTTQDIIFRRMVGAKNKQELDIILKNERIKAIYDKYNVRYQREKILNQLVARNFLSSKLGKNRRTFLSFTLSFPDLEKAVTNIIKKTNINYIIKQNKIKETNARRAISQNLSK